ncbi:hypothetical protein F6X51_05320 [Methylobacterium planeticum]|uniref:Uncharacterized protein n=1 Tax=Methylobacterium planeticum TaxID=2615211 RepID=A0A6N6MV67_9HYPH|nr:hypothetical protein F6X51_05320 [Methylobacterium planeticum]
MLASLLLAGLLGGCTGSGPPPILARAPAPATFRERVAALALAQVQFGSVSVLPVRFEKSRIAGPFEDGGRTLYCVTSRMRGRAPFEAERAKVVIREEIGTQRLSVVADDEEACSGHRAVPFPELETDAARRG